MAFPRFLVSIPSLKILACLLAATVFTGCVTPKHLVLQAPPTSAPDEERVAAYESLRPVNVQQRTGVYAYPLGNTFITGAYNYMDYIQLNDGQRVQWPEDLIPVVAPKSPSAAAIERWQNLNEQRKTLGTAMWITMASVAGASLVAGTAGAIWFTQVPENENTAQSASIGLTVCGFISALMLPLLTQLGFLIPIAPIANEMDRERETAFSMYDQSLRKRLALPESGPVTGEAFPEP